MKRYALLLSLTAICGNLSAQYEDFKAEVSGGGGILSRGSGTKAAGYGFVAVDLAFLF